MIMSCLTHRFRCGKCKNKTQCDTVMLVVYLYASYIFITITIFRLLYPSVRLIILCTACTSTSDTYIVHVSSAAIVHTEKKCAGNFCLQFWAAATATMANTEMPEEGGRITQGTPIGMICQRRANEFQVFADRQEIDSVATASLTTIPMTEIYIRNSILTTRTRFSVKYYHVKLSLHRSNFVWQCVAAASPERQQRILFALNSHLFILLRYTQCAGIQFFDIFFFQLFLFCRDTPAHTQYTHKRKHAHTHYVTSR